MAEKGRVGDLLTQAADFWTILVHLPQLAIYFSSPLAPLQLETYIQSTHHTILTL